MRFSLRLKLLVVFILTAAVILGIYSWIMIDLFEKDKKTYIFDLNADIAINLSEEVHTFINSQTNDLKIITNLLKTDVTTFSINSLLKDKKDFTKKGLSIKNFEENSDLITFAVRKEKERQKSKILKIVFEQNEDFIAYFLYSGEKLSSQIYNRRVLKKNKIEIKEILKNMDNEPLPYENILSGEIFIRNITLHKTLPAILIAVPYEISPKKILILAGVVSTKKLVNWINKSTAFESYIIDQKGRIIAHRNIEDILLNKNLSRLDIVKELLKKDANAGVIPFKGFDGEKLLGAYSTVKGTGLGVVVQRPHEDALMALKKIREKAINLIFYIFAVALGASVIFAKRMTRPLEKLAEGAKDIGKGIFTTMIPINSKDEIGDLANTFNDMAKKLDMREKELRNTYEKLVKSERLAGCYLIGQKITSTLDLEKVFQMSVQYSRDLADVKSALLFLYDKNSHELRGKASDGISEQIGDIVYKVNTNYSNQSSSWHDEIGSTDEFKDFLKTQFSMNTYIAIPITLFDRLYGMLILVDKFTGQFSEHDFNLVYLFAAQCAIACENARLFKNTEFLAVRDGLTGLFNRNYFAERSKEEFDAIKRNFRPFSYIILDIDHFKSINDTYGHVAGDAVLKDLASVLNGCLRDKDIIFRYGGEEFVVMLTDTDSENAKMLAERLRRSVENYNFTFNNTEITVTISLGVSSVSDINIEETNKDPLYLLKCADKALYEAKEGGRNRVEMYKAKVNH